MQSRNVQGREHFQQQETVETVKRLLAETREANDGDPVSIVNAGIKTHHSPEQKYTTLTV